MFLQFSADHIHIFVTINKFSGKSTVMCVVKHNLTGKSLDLRCQPKFITFPKEFQM